MPLLPSVGGGGSFYDRALQSGGQAIRARGSQQPSGSTTGFQETSQPGKSAGGGMMAAAGGGIGGYALLGATALGGPLAVGVGAAFGLAAYYLS